MYVGLWEFYDPADAQISAPWNPTDPTGGESHEKRSLSGQCRPPYDFEKKEKKL